jgi:predicted dinucleotide-binding enzyme
MTTAVIGTGGIGSVIARALASGGETLRLSSANAESARTLAHRIGLTGGMSLLTCQRHRVSEIREPRHLDLLA